MLDHYRKHLNNHCTCKDSEDVVIFTYYYGDGAYWNGKACRKCKAITEGRMPYEGIDYYESRTGKLHPDRPKDGVPDWAEENDIFTE